MRCLVPTYLFLETRARERLNEMNRQYLYPPQDARWCSGGLLKAERHLGDELPWRAAPQHREGLLLPLVVVSRTAVEVQVPGALRALLVVVGDAGPEERDL